MPQNRISIFDTTLRDGEQSPGCSMDLDEKLRMAEKLEELGVDIIEAGFPIASEGDFAAVKAVAARCRGVKVAALCRTADRTCAPPEPLRSVSPNSYLLRHVRHSSRTQTEEVARRSDRDDSPRSHAGAQLRRRRRVFRGRRDAQRHRLPV